MKVLFRADSSEKIGHGHIKRDLILARKYQEVSFACIKLKGNIIDEIPYKVFLLPNNHIQELIKLILKEKFQLLIIDHYDISKADEKAIKTATNIKIMSFDDEIKAHYCDILLNVNPYAKAEFYKDLVPDFCELRCGFDYALIREEFYKEAQIKREKKYDIFICIGGTDDKNLSAKIAKKLPKNLKIIIATTSKNRHLDCLKKMSDENTNISLGIDLQNFAQIMNESKKLIISASSLVNEALILKADFKAICLAKNQEKIAYWLKNQNKEVEFYE